MTDRAPDTVIAAFDEALSGEYAATYAYGLVGSHVSGAAQARASRSLDAHRVLRDQLRRDLTILGATPAAAAPAYAPPQPVVSAASAAALAVTVEQRLVRSWSRIAAVSGGDSRRNAAQTAQQCAIRAISWGASAQAFPG